MSEAKVITATAENPNQPVAGIPYPPVQGTIVEERRERKRKLTAALRVFGRLGFDEGVAGHFTVRDPEHTDQFWVNPFGRSFKQMRVSDLILVNHAGEITQGKGRLNAAAFAIHSQIHQHLPHVTAAAHTHSLYGKTWASLGRLLDPLTQDSCAFYNDHVLFDDFTGVVLDTSEGERIATALGTKKAAILQNHGLLTVGQTIDEAAWWYITMERSCQSQLMAEAAGKPVQIRPEIAALTQRQVGSAAGGWFSFQPLLDVINAEQPDMYDE
ncbi:MAG: class II aldolase/adducin family protein [Pseudomonadales bacterium]|jgi:ribulose-5-phosphate 4-epimerase/fuculose-1-phosphate aldolase|nr:class II aldolase/adducin family protein [Pseudomonadales bacterium]MDP4766146.1 class II aldolase/adducin family protein [Pseudomonadales bacterium]MDP4875813.1 class II aldolase/adducin family protein [Pseudomonadales bacterium]MDP4912155.1 class II aldolase/adducin family protein [Pseudomonadales bacterium]MDP5059718.1 class II aldolase/adducin family protein [Pseudomonadales bacterium]